MLRPHRACTAEQNKGAQALRDEAGTLAIRASVPIPAPLHRELHRGACGEVRRGATSKKVRDRRAGARGRRPGAVRCRGTERERGAVLLGCWLVWCREAEAARSSGMRQLGPSAGAVGAMRQCASSTQPRVCWVPAGAQLAWRQRRWRAWGDEVPGNPPYAPCPRCGPVPRTPFLFACWLPSSRSTVCDADAPWARTPLNCKFGSSALKGR